MSSLFREPLATARKGQLFGNPDRLVSLERRALALIEGTAC